MSRRRSCRGKRRYRDKLEADRALRRILQRSTRKKKPSRVYYCERCKGHHLTAQAPQT